MKELDIREHKKQPEISVIDPCWTPSIILSKKGIFRLNDICKAFKLSSPKLKAEAFRVAKTGRSSYLEVGIAKDGSEWLVSMEHFSYYYTGSILDRVNYVDPNWDGNMLLSQKGLFYLAEVIPKIPFNGNQLRYQARKYGERSREVIGIWKDEEEKAYLVDMVTFSRWITKTWTDDS